MSTAQGICCVAALCAAVGAWVLVLSSRWWGGRGRWLGWAMFAAGMVGFAATIGAFGMYATPPVWGA